MRHVLPLVKLDDGPRTEDFRTWGFGPEEQERVVIGDLVHSGLHRAEIFRRMAAYRWIADEHRRLVIRAEAVGAKTGQAAAVHILADLSVWRHDVGHNLAEFGRRDALYRYAGAVLSSYLSRPETIAYVNRLLRPRPTLAAA